MEENNTGGHSDGALRERSAPALSGSVATWYPLVMKFWGEFTRQVIIPTQHGNYALLGSRPGRGDMIPEHNNIVRRYHACSDLSSWTALSSSSTADTTIVGRWKNAMLLPLRANGLPVYWDVWVIHREFPLTRRSIFSTLLAEWSLWRFEWGWQVLIFSQLTSSSSSCLSVLFLPRSLYCMVLDTLYTSQFPCPYLRQVKVDLFDPFF